MSFIDESTLENYNIIKDITIRRLNEMELLKDEVDIEMLQKSLFISLVKPKSITRIYNRILKKEKQDNQYLVVTEINPLVFTDDDLKENTIVKEIKSYKDPKRIRKIIKLKQEDESEKQHE